MSFLFLALSVCIALIYWIVYRVFTRRTYKIFGFFYIISAGCIGGEYMSSIKHNDFFFLSLGQPSIGNTLIAVIMIIFLLLMMTRSIRSKN